MSKFFLLDSGDIVEVFSVLAINREYGFVNAQNKTLLTAELDDEKIKFKVIDWGSVEQCERNESVLSSFAHSIAQENLSGIEEISDEYNKSPFNPEDISIDTRSLPLEGIIRRMRQKTLILNPDFQRNEVWDKDKKSRLIESLMLKIPIPMFYVSADRYGNYTVIDGLQRLSAIRDFVLGPISTNQTTIFEKEGIGLKLKNLEFWKEFEGKTMNDLPIYLRNRILETQCTFTVVNPGTPEEVQFTIFKRINTGGEPLKAQEIRNAMYGGSSSKFLNDLAGSSIFKKATNNTVRPQRMQDMELVLGFCAFYIRSFKSYPQNGNLDLWLSHTMLIMNQMKENDAKKSIESMASKKHINIDTLQCYKYHDLQIAFEMSLNRAYLLFGDFAFRKSYEGLRRTPINKSLFSLWAVVLAQLNNQEFDCLLNNKETFDESYHSLLIDSTFVSSISRHSLFKTNVTHRFIEINKLVHQIINN